MTRGRTIVLLALACGLTALSVPSLAAARIAYFTGAEEGGYAAPADLVAETLGGQTPFFNEGPPGGVAISPDGRTAYVAGEVFEPPQSVFGALVPIDVATNVPGTPIPVGEFPRAVAITPDGSRAYVTNVVSGSVSPVDLASGIAGTEIPMPGEPLGIAITPDGSTAYVAIRDEDEVVPIDLGTNVAGTPIPVGEGPTALSATPDGSGVYVTNATSDTVSRIDPATNAVTQTIPVAADPQAIAITPDSGRAYVLGFDSPITPIDLASGTAGTAIELAGHFLGGIAILPDGSRAYVTDESASELVPVEIPADTVASGFGSYSNPDQIAIVPDQPPRADFTPTPSETRPGVQVAFDATASNDTDGGSVARYDWDFGDGTTLPDGGPTPTHGFAKSGNYTVTLTTTDDEGCSTEIVFPGQTAFCNGSSIARTTRQVKVSVPCNVVSGSATSFVPKFRSAHIAPGIRVRLAATLPAHLAVHATLEWRRHGHRRAARLAKRETDVRHWRRIRFPIPRKLRGQLPIGAALKVKLKIVATPLEGDACSGKTTTKTLRVKVVKVIPGAEQHGRRR